MVCPGMLRLREGQSPLKLDCHHPTEPFTNLELQNPGIDAPYLFRKCRSTDLEALNYEYVGRAGFVYCC